MSDLQLLADWLNRIGEQLNDDKRRVLTRKISVAVRQNWAKRIRSQQDPNGAGFTPRRNNRRNRKRSGKMFKQAPRMLKNVYTSDKAEIGFAGQYAKIMEVHQYGLTINPSPTARATTYDVRETVGFSDDDVQIIEKQMQDFLLNI